MFDGTSEGKVEGSCVGILLGCTEGYMDGIFVGSLLEVGNGDGSKLGNSEG